jgi:DNA-binding IclR family transcriptional regulator
MREKPAYFIASVDHALHLATVLQREGPIRVTDAADRLDVARSTAHRLLSMLVYRDFAEQDEDRRYTAGPALCRPLKPEPASDLRRAALPHLRALTEQTGETSNVMVVVADEVRFVASIECNQVLRVGNREGRVLPAHRASGGRIVLATRPEAEVRQLYEHTGSRVVDVDVLIRELRRIRRQGFAVNNQRTETGVTAIGCVIRGSLVAAAISLAMPTARYRRDRLLEWAGLLGATAEGIGRDLEA